MERKARRENAGKRRDRVTIRRANRRERATGRERATTATTNGGKS